MKAAVFALPMAAAFESEWAEFQALQGARTGDIPAAFKSNANIVREFNAGSDFQLSLSGPFAAMTNEEYHEQVKGLKRGLPVLGGAKQSFEATGKAIADSKDWRDDGVVTPTKDQGGCGSCWAFSAAETYESHLALATGTLSELSAQQIVSCSPNPDHCGGTGGCQGSTQPLAFDYLVGVGLTTEASYPYTQRTGTCDESKIAPVGYSTGYVELPTNDYTALMDAAANVGPVAISIAAAGFKFQLYGSGVLSNCNDFVMDHAVQLVGYGTDSGSDYYLVRNSWGRSWGEGGYVRFARYGEGSEPCGTDSQPQDGDACAGDTTPRTYCGECGLLSASSYPTGMSDSPSATVSV